MAKTNNPVMFVPRPLLALSALIAAILAIPGTATAVPTELPPPAAKPASLLETTVGVEGTTTKPCNTAVRAGEPGVATRQVHAPAVGQLDVRLDGAGGDWDVALFNPSGRELGGGASPGAHEIASGFAMKAETITLQACRRAGDAETARLSASFTPIEVDPTPEKTQLVDVLTPTRFDKDRLTALGFDMTEHGGTDSLGAVLHGDADAERLRRAGFEYRVLVEDLVAHDLRNRRRELRSATTRRAAPVPSGRTTYRTLADYENEMKTLAQQNPGLVRLIELPFKTLLGRAVYGLEISTNVNANDGKPAFFNMGVHHAREWPSGEHTMEWAYELINGFKAGDARAKKVVEQSRNLVVPIVNPDGFNASRSAAGAPAGGRDEAEPDTAYAILGAGTGGEYRRKNCRLGTTDSANCLTSPGLGAENGVDPNRNYGGLWGGPGAETEETGLTYRGPGPFSEAETKNIQWLTSRRQVTTLITNHTTAGLVLRAPGVAAIGSPVDESRGYKALGDAMAMENGYFSQKGYELYDTTGTTEDWSYNATGGFGFTFEIYCGSPNYESGDCDDPAFHPFYETMAKEWDGSSDQSNHTTDPGRSDAAPFGMQANYDGKGNREAYYIAAESTIDESRHSVLEGEGVPGATLRLTKSFKTETFPQENGQPILLDDKLETVYDVDASGRFRWHVNPSTRPAVAKDRGDREQRQASPAETQTGSALGPDPQPPEDDGTAAPSGDANTTDPTQYNIHHVRVPATGYNASVNLRVVWTTPGTDWDVKLYEDTNNSSTLNAGDRQIGASETGPGTSEEVGVYGDPRLEPGKLYLVRVTNFVGGEPYDLEISWNGPLPFRAATTEQWTLTCEAGGRVLETQQVLIDRGERKALDLAACRRALNPAPTPQPQPPRPRTCTAGTGFRSVGVTPRGRGLQFRFSRRVNRPVTISVFQQSTGRRILGERLVARFTRRTRAFAWSGRPTGNRKRLRDGYLFARFSIQTPNGVDVRRLTLRRSRGRFVKRPDFYRRATCDALPSFKIERPVFGGASNRPLNISFRVTEAARVQVDVLRGTRRVRRFGPTNRRAGLTHRLRVDPKTLRRGEYRIKITVFVGARPLTATLVARRL